MTEVPHVYKAIAKILGELSVAKGATLPANMGGKPYITAVDLNSEIKRKFVENNLIHLPREREVSKEIIIGNGGRVTVALSVEGEYTIISTEDGSTATISGAGDGLANGSAVASNIASTNALKNALLRTFLVTEQSAEDAAKNGVDEAAAPAAAQTPAARKIAQAQSNATPKAGDDELASLQAKVREFISNPEFPYDSTMVNALGAKIAKDAGREKFVNTDKPIVKKLVAALEKGEVA